MITRAHCLPFVGQRVVVQTRGGATHYGILHSATNDGIYLRPISVGRAGLVSNIGSSPFADVLENIPQSADDITDVFFPFLFFPYLALGGLGPWGLWW